MAAGQRNLIGRLSYTESYRLGVLAVKTFYSYDEVGNVAWTAHSDLNGYGKKISYSYDLQGNVTSKIYKDYYPGSETISVINSYDKAGRLSTVTSEYNASNNREALYQYFASGKLKRLQLGNAQGVDYRYNQRDWLTMINHQNLDESYNGIPQDPGADGIGTGRTGLPADKFGMVIGYNIQKHIGLPQYQNAAPHWNGNISWLIYRMKDVYSFSTDVVGYTFSYDKANRLRNADFGYCEASWLTTNAYDEIIPDAQGYPGYDKNGNIMGLTRYSSTDSISDNFIYNYPEPNNRLKSISGTSAIQYKYDGNGNVIKDSGKNIALIIYDTDNLPVTVYKNDGSQIQYYYDVNGDRVKKTIVGGSSTYYINGFDGKTEVVSHVPTGSDFTYNIWGNDLIGQVRVVGTTATRYYYLKDHLGNIRMTVNSAGNPVNWDDYYSFGSVMNGRSQISSADNRYKFTGKERDTETNYDYFGARYYDSRIARWLQVDPLASKYPGWSPYNYTLNNPIRLIDTDGRVVGDPITLSAATVTAIGVGVGVTITAGILVTTEYLKNPASNPAPSNLTIGLKAASLGVDLYNKVNSWFTDNNTNQGEDATDKKNDIYAPNRPLPKDENGNAIPESQSPHTELGTRESKKRDEKYKQAREYGENGKKVRDIDFTDHGRKDHPNPHQHNYDPKTGKRGGPQELTN